MNYEAFLEYVKNSVEKFMGDGFTISLNKVFKDNGLELTGLVIREKSRNTAPTIYLEGLYREYCNGMEMGAVINKIIEVYEENSSKLEVDFSRFADYEWMKPRILYRLINYEANEKMLEDLPHKRYMDLAMVFFILFEHDVVGDGIISIHNKHMELWNVDVEELSARAMENTQRMLPYRFSCIEHAMEALLKSESSEDVLDNDVTSGHNMYVLTNTRKTFGAATLLYENMIKKIANKVKDSFYIVPSSVHEVIIIPKQSFPHEKKDLQDMVKNINEEEMELGDILSARVYEYDRELDEILWE